MASSFKRTTIKSFPKVNGKVTSDSLFWKNLEFPILQKQFGAISHIEFSPVVPYDFAVTNSTRVQIYSTKTNQAEKTFSRFKEIAYGGSFRSDGRLLIAGGDEGFLRLFDIQGKSLLRVFKGHQGPVHVSKFMTDKLRVFSASDDKSVCVWDIATEKKTVTYREHQDYIRCGATSQAAKDIIISGSYDHTVKLYDTRIPESVLTVNHGHPVESVLIYPSGGIFITAGGNVVKVWDALAGGKLFTQLSHHHKTVTCLGLCKNNQRLISAGLDRHLKIFDVSTYQMVHSLDYPGAILSAAVSPDDKVIAVGTADGLLSIRHHKPNEEEKKQIKKKKASFKYIIKGRIHTAQKGDFHVEHKRREHLAKYDKYFRKFEHTKALDTALQAGIRTKSPGLTISVIQELVRRGGIRATLAGRDDKSLGILLKFIQRNISSPKFIMTLVDISNIILEIYAPQIGQSTIMDDMLHRLKETIDKEVKYMKSLYEVMGTMDTLFAIADNKEQSTQNADTLLNHLEPSIASQIV